MKVLIGEFITESNENIPCKNEITAYDIAFGEECVHKMHVGDIFAQAGIEVIPAVYAVSGASGVIKRHTFDYIEACFIRTVEEHLNEIDGIYMMLHGASEVEGLGSGEHHILAEVRKRVGPYVPIYIACDPHGNLCKEYVESAQVVRSYRESPHTDSIQTRRIVAGMLCEALKKRENIHAVYRKLPLILGGEQSVSADEPVKSINQYMDEMEKDPRICSASWHVGYIRHDTPVAGCGIVVTPATAADQEYAEQAADALAAYVWDKRHEFHYTGLTAEPDKALEMAMAQEKGPVFITDSGDNVTSGATGWNTYILRQVLALKDTDKTFLFASICDPQCCRGLMEAEIGEERHITLGVGHDELSAPVELDVTVKSKGEIVRSGTTGSTIMKVFGHCVTAHVKKTGIDIVVADSEKTFSAKIIYDRAHVDWNDYDITVVKQGYIFPELKEAAAFYVMSLTGGATPQNTKKLQFKRIQRPMYPIDEI
ncbi:MAG: M81 family metallopeptidase [Faecalibacterium prausnitzii]|nr:M81 family metallopeptidase [Faecalibacterium prausnitzii]